VLRTASEFIILITFCLVNSKVAGFVDVIRYRLRTLHSTLTVARFYCCYMQLHIDSDEALGRILTSRWVGWTLRLIRLVCSRPNYTAYCRAHKH